MDWPRRFFRRKKRDTWTDLVAEIENDASTEELALLNALREQVERDTGRGENDDGKEKG